MPRIDATGLPRKEYPIFLLVERSEDIKTTIRVYELLKNIRLALFEVQNLTPDVELKVGFYTFSSANYSMCPEKLVSLEELNFEKLNDDKIVDLSNVFCRLSNDLSRSTLLMSETGYVAPNIILIFDGSKRYIDNGALTKLNENKWFRYARKIALSVNEHDSIKNDVINKFTGTDEAVVKFADIDTSMELVRNLLTCVSISGSIIATHSQSVDDAIVFVDPIEADAWGNEDDWE